ncbi:MAG: 50S ribosomal protein L30 [Zetaproteobacteria bacterium]|nr:MAG: 50S ribosomal protein L30 [Zetaproteobacteria bacterium]
MAKKKTISIRQVKSGIGYSKDQKATLRGLGFRRLNQVVELEDTPAVRGMVNKVRHLVRIESGE